MPFIQTCSAQSESASPKATTLYVYIMSLFLVACLLNRCKEQAVQAPPPPPREYLHLLLQNKARDLTTSRSSKPPFPDSANVIAAEVEVSQRRALRQNSCKSLSLYINTHTHTHTHGERQTESLATRECLW